MAQFTQALDLEPALVLRLGGQAIEPCQERNAAVVVLVEDHAGLGHPYLLLNCSHKCEQKSSGQLTVNRRTPRRSERRMGACPIGFENNWAFPKCSARGPAALTTT